MTLAALREIDSPTVPRLARLCALWDKARAGHGLPGREVARPEALDFVRDDLMILELAPDSEGFRLFVAFAGDTVARITGRDINGQWLDEVMPEPFLGFALESCREVVEARRPSITELALGPNDAPFTYERVLLPLAGADGAVAAVAYACDWPEGLAAFFRGE